METPKPPGKQSIFRKLGGGSLTISLLVHGALFAAAIFWIIQVIPPEPEKTVEFKPSGGGGGGAPKVQQAKSQSRMV
ncbi:MAG: hypothetical protein EOP87_14140, partial [Verrucomicrobiaceae bacterium]